MTIYHTSAEKIEEIYEDGVFGTHIFFASEIYVMTGGDYVVYEIEINDDDILRATSMFYDENWALALPAVEEVKQRFSVDDQTAMDLLDESKFLHELIKEDEIVDHDDSWWIQKMTAKAAKMMGYSAVAVQDETGISYMLDLKVYKEMMKLQE